MIVGGYSLHLYCDGDRCPKVTATGRTACGEFDAWNYRQAKRAAMAAGWTFKRDRKTYNETCYCKECSNDQAR